MILGPVIGVCVARILAPITTLGAGNLRIAPLCCKQPLSLKSAALEIVFRLRFNIEKFRLDSDTTYDQYVYVARHYVNIPIERLVPFSGFPITFKMQYTEFDYSSLGRIHENCLNIIDNGMSRVTRERRISSPEEFVKFITGHKTRFWCAHCSKALFLIPYKVRLFFFSD